MNATLSPSGSALASGDSSSAQSTAPDTADSAGEQPVVIVGAHRSWEARTFTIHGVEMPVHVAPAMDTSHWSLDRIDEALEELHAHFRRVLPADQQPDSQGAA